MPIYSKVQRAPEATTVSHGSLNPSALTEQYEVMQESFARPVEANETTKTTETTTGSQGSLNPSALTEQHKLMQGSFPKSIEVNDHYHYYFII